MIPVTVTTPASRAVAQNSLMPATRWSPSIVAVPRFTVLGSAFNCSLNRCDDAAAVGLDARVAGAWHVAVDARMPGLEYTTWYGWRRVSIGATVGTGNTIPLVATDKPRSETVSLIQNGTWDTVYTNTSSVAPTHWSSAAARMTWRADRWWATALVGRVAVVDHGSALWGGLQLGADMTRGASLLLGLGTTSRVAALASPEPLRHNLSLGLGFNSSIFSRQASDAPKASVETRNAFAVANVGVDRVRITIRSPLARTIEFASDCTGWKPLGMTQTHDGWIVEVTAPRGLHRANIRVDGGRWIAPPGLASSDDDFAGEVGIFVVE
jgi:hypothetical protein